MTNEEIDKLPKVTVKLPKGADEIEFLKNYLGGEYCSHEEMPPDDEIEESFLIDFE